MPIKDKFTSHAIAAMIASWFLNIFLLIFKIRLKPNDIVAPSFLFLLVWLFPLFFFVKHIFSRPSEKKTPLLLLFIIFIIFFCTNLFALAPALKEEVNNCSAQYSGLQVRYECTCTVDTVEWSKVYDCKYSGFRFIPFVREK